MTLKFQYDALPDDMPDAHKSLYREENGKFILDCEGVVAKTKHDEFRQTNINLVKERDALAAVLKEKGATETEMAQAVQKHQTELDESRQREREATKKLRGTLFRQEVTSKALASGVLASAIDDVVFRAGNAFDIDDDGQLVGREGNAADAQAWMDGLKSSAGHLFANSSGGGAGGNTRPASLQRRIKTRADLPDAAAKAQFIHEHGSEAYLKLPVAPGVKVPGTISVTRDSELRKRTAADQQYIDRNGLQR